jgi:hypothetical protein
MDQINWLWSKGEAFGDNEFGTGDAAYALCVYDMTGSSPTLAASMFVPPSPYWTIDPKRHDYHESHGDSFGVRKVLLKPGASGSTSIKFVAKGENLTLPGPAGTTYFDQDPAVVVQLANTNGTCWTSEFAVSDTLKHDPALFRAKASR